MNSQETIYNKTMEKEDNSQANDTLPTSFQMVIGESSSNTNNQMVDYMVNSHSTQQQQQQRQQQNQGLLGFLPSNSSSSLDKLSFADVMQFADFGPKLALNQTKVSEEDGGIDPVYFLKFPVLNEKNDDDGDDDDEALMLAQGDDQEKFKLVVEGGDGKEKGDQNIVERSIGNIHHEVGNKNNKRKRPRIKTSEEVESQRMTHIAVERNRRKQMNEHLRVLRSLMPGSYVQRGDQASIIGGAIEFVRELEQLLQCLESQKRRRIYGDNNNNNTPTRPLGDSSNNINATPSILPINQNPNQPPLLFPLPNEYIEGGIQEEMAESKSCLADVEVKLLGFDAMIKILSRRRPGQLIKAIAALEDMQLTILHTNITTIEQTVLYSFNVKISGETRYTADDIANSIQQIFSFIHAEITPYDVN